MSTSENIKLPESLQLVDVNNFDADKRIIFGTPETSPIPGNPKMTYSRINLKVMNPDGKSVSDLVLPTQSLFSFGFSESKNEQQQITGYSCSLCLYSKGGATKEEKTFVDTYLQIVAACKKHLLQKDIKKKINKLTLSESSLEKFGGLYWKRDSEGEIIEEYGPTLYPKLIVSKKHGTPKILTNIYGCDGEKINPLSIMGQYCVIEEAVIKIESIFAGKDVSLQVKLWEATVRIIEFGLKKLLKTTVKTDTKTPESEDDDDTSDEDEKLNG